MVIEGREGWGSIDGLSLEKRRERERGKGNMYSRVTNDRKREGKEEREREKKKREEHLPEGKHTLPSNWINTKERPPSSS